MTTTYYEVLSRADDKPVSKSQRRLFGTPRYGYATLLAAVKAASKATGAAYVRERHSDGMNDWAGRIVSWKE